MSQADQKSLLRKAAAYVRMSTEHQQYSTDNQLEVIREYARLHHLEIVRIYSDEGKSGLTIQGRNGLAEMIRDVESGQADYSSILVYDISRWGRFQDNDESAHYEYVCRRAGVRVHFCAEQFENDGSSFASIVKGVKRAMAGEFSRELSHKVFQGACRLIRLGFRQGGAPGYGLRRQLIDQNKQSKGVLQPGERKSLQTDRVIIVPGPPEEVQVVHWIYRMFIDEGKGEGAIVRLLNARGIPSEGGQRWTRMRVETVLRHEKYIGNNLYYRGTVKLMGKKLRNPPEKWIRAEGVFQGIVNPKRFAQAQQIIQARRKRYDPQAMLVRLGEIYRQHGRLSCKLLKQHPEIPSAYFFSRHFGNMISVYRQLGFQSRFSYSHMSLSRRLTAMTHELGVALSRQLAPAGAIARWLGDRRILSLNGELHIYIHFVRCGRCESGIPQWVIRFKPKDRADLNLLVRMDTKNEHILDYYLIPGLETQWKHSLFRVNNGIYLDTYRFATLDFLINLVRRTKIPKTYE